MDSCVKLVLDFKHVTNLATNLRGNICISDFAFNKEDTLRTCVAGEADRAVEIGNYWLARNLEVVFILLLAFSTSRKFFQKPETPIIREVKLRCNEN